MNVALLLLNSSTLVHLSPIDLVIIVFYFALVGKKTEPRSCMTASRRSSSHSIKHNGWLIYARTSRKPHTNEVKKPG